MDDSILPPGRKVIPKDSYVAKFAEAWGKARPDLDQDRLLLSIYIMRLGNIVENSHGRRCRAYYGISSREMHLLLLLRRVGPPYRRRPTDLFRALLVTPGAITKQVDRLQADGFVVRLADPDYGGGFLIQLTDKGREAADWGAEDLASHSVLAQVTRDFAPEKLNEGLTFCEALLVPLESAQLDVE